MFKRVFDFFKRDKAKKEVAPVITHMEAPKPDKAPKTKRSWITRWIRHRRRFGPTAVRCEHITKSMNHNYRQRTDFSASADLHIDRLKGRVPPRKAERFEIGLGSRKFKVAQ
jgi:hypothetical protein